MSPKVSFLVALIVVTGLVAACSDESSDPVVVSPQEVAAATTPDSTPQVVVVEKVLDAANAGDYVEWVIHFAADAVIPLSTLADVSVQDHFEFEAAIHTQRVATEPCQMVSGSVECTLRIENDLFAAAGIAPELSAAFFLDTSDHIVTVSEGFSTEIVGFLSAFTTWLQETEPDVYDEIMEAPTPAYVLTTPATAALLLAHIDRFVADSPDYPKP